MSRVITLLPEVFVATSCVGGDDSQPEGCGGHDEM